MAFAHLAFRESPRDVIACLGCRAKQLYHMGSRGRIRRSTLADANERRDWRIYHDFAMCLIAEARDLYRHEPLGMELDELAYAVDSTTISLCSALSPWARYKRTLAGPTRSS